MGKVGGAGGLVVAGASAGSTLSGASASVRSVISKSLELSLHANHKDI